MVARIAIRCCFAPAGCTYGSSSSGAAADLERHEAECVYRTMRCPFNNSDNGACCNAEVSLAALLDHAEREHRARKVEWPADDTIVVEADPGSNMATPVVSAYKVIEAKIRLA